MEDSRQICLRGRLTPMDLTSILDSGNVHCVLPCVDREIAVLSRALQIGLCKRVMFGCLKR